MRTREKNSSVLSGEAERERVHAAVPLRRVLFSPQVEGAGVPQRRLDLGVRGPEAPRKDRQLHPHYVRGRKMIAQVDIIAIFDHFS